MSKEKGDLPKVLGDAEHRADELRRTLQSFDATRRGGRFGVVLQQFEQLSKQLVLLQERTTDPNTQELLERQFVVPQSVSNLGSAAASGITTAALPNMLSTMLDKEQEELGRDSEHRLSEGGISSEAEQRQRAAIASHNQAIDSAHDYLAKIASRAELPGAVNISALGSGKAGKRQRT